MIADAASKGVSHIILGLGGSCTNDAGCGAAAACGVKFLGIAKNACKKKCRFVRLSVMLMTASARFMTKE